jgi:ABC-type antimicrobial peptide transport system permease subunit
MRWVDVRDAPAPTLYVPFATNHLQAFADQWAQMNFTVRCAGDVGAVSAAVRQAVRAVDPTLPVTEMRTLGEQVERTFAREQLMARLSSVFGGVALVLACVGLYGLMTYAVLSRTGEIGLRMALGALPRNILQMILGESLRLVGFGAILGIGAAWVGTRWIAALLYGFSPTDPLTYAAVALLLAAVAVLACWLPARRAAKVDPMVALRAE